MQDAITILPQFETNYSTKCKGTFVSIHIADIHFGAIDEKAQYDILKEQFIDRISILDNIDLICIDGDLFEHKYMANSNVIYYAQLFIDNLVEFCRNKNTTLILLHGTYSHDSNQLKLFYHYLQDNTVDIRIVETIKFEYVRGVKILCIPELYNIDDSIYNEYLFNSGLYDQCIIHGTIKGSVYGDNVGQSKLFTINDFKNCIGPTLAGHIHTGGCFNSHFYYCGSALRYKFGEEEPKGFLVVIQDLETRKYLVEKVLIESFSYKTIYLDDIISNDPKDTINYINQIKDNNIDHLRIVFNNEVPSDIMLILNNYYHSINNIKLQYENDAKSKIMKKNASEMNILGDLSFVLDKSLSEYEILAKYINYNKGYEYITVDKLKEIINEEF